MDILVTKSKSLLALNIHDGSCSTVHTGKGLYYGISYSPEFIFVGARNNDDCFCYLGALENERGEILVFNYDLELVDVLRPPFALRDLHQILWFDNKLWVTCSLDNMVAVYDFKKWQKWYPSMDREDRGKDVHHFNSFCYDGQLLYLLAHNFGDSEVWQFSYPGLQCLKKIKIGSYAHNIWFQDQQMFTCDSQNGRVLNSSGKQVEIGGFPRGVIVTDEYIIIGTSDVAERDKRSDVTSKIIVFDRSWHKLSSLVLAGHGQLLDMRVPGVQDLCVPIFSGRDINKLFADDFVVEIKS